MRASNTPTSNPPEFAGEIDIGGTSDRAWKELAERTVRAILATAGFRDGTISIAVVDDPTIHDLNRRFLDHDWPTDVLTFPLACDVRRKWIEAEIVVSRDTAQREASQQQWPEPHELLLYVIHGALHLTGLDDTTDQSRSAMRRAEHHWLHHAGIHQK